jgi:hypothetical protein
MAALIDWFEKPLMDLPREKRERVEREFAPLHWDSMTTDQRKSRAESCDFQHDPATEQDREDLWDFFLRKSFIEKQIAEWKAVATPTAGDLAQQEARLTELRQELARIAEDDERDEPSVSPCRPVSASQIRHNFPVIKEEDANAKWWKEKMRDAARNGLLVCRVGEGKKGQGRGSLWRPDLVAVWLVDRHAKGRKGLPADAVRAALKKFLGCEEVADDLFPPDE